MNTNEILDEILSDIYTESLVSSINQRKFIKKYKFVPNPRNPRQGTIIVDGVQYTVLLVSKDRANVYVSKTGGTMDASGLSTCCVTLTNGEVFIALDDSFFNIVGGKPRDSIFQHEIGHSRYHGYPTVTQYTDRELITVDSLRSALKDDALYTNNNPNVSPEELEKTVDQFLDWTIQGKITTLRTIVKRGTLKKSDRAKLRDECIKYIRKVYPPKQKTYIHDVTSEVEADLYAVNKVGSKAFTRGERQIAMRAVADARKLYARGKITREQYEQYKKVMLDESKKRATYTNDPVLRDIASKVYK